jgi:hypothetical protein
MAMTNTSNNQFHQTDNPKTSDANTGMRAAVTGVLATSNPSNNTSVTNNITPEVSSAPGYFKSFFGSLQNRFRSGLPEKTQSDRASNPKDNVSSSSTPNKINYAKLSALTGFLMAKANGAENPSISSKNVSQPEAFSPLNSSKSP